ncbi:hypothetical protein [Roseimaritima ulvae]|uniref:DUF4345 domain-containing protein n=1 Tax=Roseimaritima ulvae TaxID=980254 RepID=A0A5B9QNB4_9BACT|nr:hypothetical protein [Roseimaritima ulvae]QEG38965.1 hypothetical protein UC8_09260 [Roseimaritima ulvae]
MMLITKLFIGLVGIMYAGLAIWCSVQPNMTSKKVGFQLVGGSGRSEFLTVYGGLEFGIALLLLASLFSKETVIYGLWAVMLLHGSLVLFRTISLIAYADIGAFTYRLAIGEWVIFLTSVALLFVRLSRGGAE